MFVSNQNSQRENPNPLGIQSQLGTDHKFFVGLKLTRSIWNAFALVADVASYWSFVDAKRTAEETRAASNYLYLLSCTALLSDSMCPSNENISTRVKSPLLGSFLWPGGVSRG